MGEENELVTSATINNSSESHEVATDVELG